MPIPLLTLIPGVLKTVARVLGGNDVLKQAAETLENVAIPPEKLVEMQLALQAHEEKMMALANQESLAMIASEDKYVARARPTGLYLFYGCSVALIIAHIAGVKIDPTFVWSVLAPLGGTGGLYIWKRTTEKMNGNGGA